MLSFIGVLSDLFKTTLVFLCALTRIWNEEPFFFPLLFLCTLVAYCMLNLCLCGAARIAGFK